MGPRSLTSALLNRHSSDAPSDEDIVNQCHKRLTECHTTFIFRFVVPQLSFFNWKQVYTQISPKEI